MWRVMLLPLALGLCSFDPPTLPAPSVPPVQPASQDRSFRATSSDLVVLPVIVKAKGDRYVADLPRERFVVYDNARRVPVQLFSKEDTPVTVGLIIDSSGSMRNKLGDVIAASVAFARSSNPNDELFAIHFNDDVRAPLGDRGFLLASDLKDLEAAVSSLAPIGRTALYDALMTGLDRVDQGTRPRKALLVISDGGDNASSVKLETVLMRARKSNVAIYTIGIYDPDAADKDPGVLKELAKATGGERFQPPSLGLLMQVCEHIAREIRSGYTLGYVPPDRDGLYHRVRVVIEPPIPHVDVRTRPGYFAARERPQS
jgi:Ca-activated chloride channel homolog